MTTSTKRSVLILCLLLLAFALRVWGPDRDPPSTDLQPDIGLWSDEGTIALPSLETIRGESCLCDGLAIISRPLHEVLLQMSFALLGAGSIQGRLLSVATGMLGLVALAGLAKSAWPDVGAFLALAFAGTGFFFVLFDRLILTEGLVVAFLSIIALAGIRSRKLWSACVTGAILGVAATGLKLHALDLLPGLVLLYALRRRRLLIPFLLSLGIVLLVWRVFWIAQVPQYTGYIETRLVGGQLGLLSPAEAIIQVLLMGLPAFYLPYQIPLLLLSTIEGLAFLLSPRQWLRRVPDSILVALPWLLMALVAASLFRYAPTRYFHIASPALVLLAIGGARRLWEGRAFPVRRAIVRNAVALGLGLLLIVQVAPPLPVFGPWQQWMPLFGISVVPLFLWLASQTSPGWNLSANTRWSILGALLVFQLFLQGGLYFVGVVQSRPDLKNAAGELAAKLPANAILAGRLSAGMALLAPLRSAPALDQISVDFLDKLATKGSVWLLVLDEDADRIDPRAWRLLAYKIEFPVNYSTKSQWLRVYQFIGSASN